MKKPIMLHQKSAHSDFLCILKSRLPELFPAILHSFSGTYEEATDYVNLGLYFGITGQYHFSQSLESVMLFSHFPQVVCVKTVPETV